MKGRLIIGALPLLVYPFIALASVMSLAGHTTGEEPVMRMAVARGFQVTSLLYPVVYVASLAAALAVRKQKAGTAAKIASAPLWFLMLVVLLFVAWIALDT
jgi:hypothetical protein